MISSRRNAIIPKRDKIDERIVYEVIGACATYEGLAYKKDHQVFDTSEICGIIDTQNDVGGWIELKSTPASEDSDHDGMPDYWEDENRLDKNNPEDRNTISVDGYTMIEKFINSIK